MNTDFNTRKTAREAFRVDKRDRETERRDHTAEEY